MYLGKEKFAKSGFKPKEKWNDGGCWDLQRGT